MSKATVQNNQNVFDIALQISGSVLGAFPLMQELGELNPTLVPGQILELDLQINSAISNELTPNPPARRLEYFEPDIIMIDWDQQDFEPQDFF